MIEFSFQASPLQIPKGIVQSSAMTRSPKDRLTRIKSGALSRGLALAKVSVSAGARAASHAMGSLFTKEEEKPDRLKALLISQVNLLADELGELKGSLMKVGQMLSVYGEHFLPPEANALLKSLQSQSPPLEWQVIEKTLLKQLGPERLALLEIDPVPLASASLGQVHLARRKSDGRKLAMKIQYPGVDQAIEGDLKTLRSLLSISKLIPKGPKYDELFKEVRAMLHQEVDYRRELEATEEFRKVFADDPRFIIPETVPELCTKRILTTSFEEGVAVDSAEVLDLPLERRNEIGKAALEFYFRELFQLAMMQTDPHFGNYRVRLGQSGEMDRLVLFDFGAVRKFPSSFLNPYRDIVRGALDRDQARLEKGALELGFLVSEDSEELRKNFSELCQLITEPFYTQDVPGVPTELYTPGGEYKWGESDLPKRVARKGAQLAFSFKLRTPPREIIFLDRKMGGIFIFLSVLKVQIRAREIIDKYLSGPI